MWSRLIGVCFSRLAKPSAWTMSSLPFRTTPATNPGKPRSTAAFLICPCKDKAAFDSPKLEGAAAKNETVAACLRKSLRLEDIYAPINQGLEGSLKDSYYRIHTIAPGQALTI